MQKVLIEYAKALYVNGLTQNWKEDVERSSGRGWPKFPTKENLRRFKSHGNKALTNNQQHTLFV